MNHIRWEGQLNRFQLLGYDTQNGRVPGRSRSGVENTGPVQQGRAEMDVRGIGSVPGVTPTRPQSGTPASPATSVSRPQAPQDQLELSSAGKMLDQLNQSPDMRAERIARIKEAIENGTYDTDEKLEAALSNLLDSLGNDLDLE